MILPLAVFLHTAVACAPKTGPSPVTLAAYAKVESGRDPLAIRDDTDHRSLYPQTAAEAIATARRLIDAGHRIGLGLMQIESGNLAWLRLPVDRAFNACDSIRAGANYLIAASRYNTGSPTRGFRTGYVASVVAAGRALPPVSVTRAAPVAPAPPTPDQPAGQPPGQARWLKADRGLKVHRGRLWRAFARHPRTPIPGLPFRRLHRGEVLMRFESAVPAQLSDDPSPWQKPEPPPFWPPEPPPNRPGTAPPFTPPEPPPFKRPEPPPWGPWFRGKIGGILEWLRRVACPVAALAFVGVPTLAHAQIASGTDPSTIISAALQFILGPVGIGL
ncbi:MAG: lytic transglycosylase domain-containing protein, partial [Acetobacteraceae bacterium]